MSPHRNTRVTSVLQMTTTRNLWKAVFCVPCLTALAYQYDGSMVHFEPFVREGLESCDQLAPELGHLFGPYVNRCFGCC